MMAIVGTMFPPSLLMYRYIGFPLSTLSRNNMVATSWFPSSSSIVCPIQIIRSRYKQFHISTHCHMFSFGVLYGTLGTPMGIIVFVRRSPARPPRDEVFIDFHARSANVSHLVRPSPRRNAPANLFPFTNPPYAPTRIVDADADVPRAPLEGRRDRSRRDDAVPFARFKTTRAPTDAVNMTMTRDRVDDTRRASRRRLTARASPRARSTIGARANPPLLFLLPPLRGKRPIIRDVALYRITLHAHTLYESLNTKD